MLVSRSLLLASFAVVNIVAQPQGRGSKQPPRSPWESPPYWQTVAKAFDDKLTQGFLVGTGVSVLVGGVLTWALNRIDASKYGPEDTKLLAKQQLDDLSREQVRSLNEIMKFEIQLKKQKGDSWKHYVDCQEREGIYPVTSMHLMYQIDRLKKCMELVQAEWEIFEASPPKRRSKDKDRNRDRDRDNEIKPVKEINEGRTSGQSRRRSRGSVFNNDGTGPPSNEFSTETPQQQQQQPRQLWSWLPSISDAGQKFDEVKQVMGSQLKHYFSPDRSAREGYKPTGFGQKAPLRFFTPH